MLLIFYLWAMLTGVGASLLGALWPVMYLDFDVALSVVGIFSWIGSGVGLVSSLSSGWILKRFGAVRTTIGCALIVALSFLGYTLSGEFWMLCLLNIPTGFAAGVVSVAANNYVALHYPSRHMSWMHCMWGVGTILGPNIVSITLQHGYSWHLSYRTIFIGWVLWAVLLFFLRRRWKPDAAPAAAETRPSLSTAAILRLRGAKETLLTFFCYNSLEQGIMLWMSSYLVLHFGMTEERSATYTSLFFAGITAGRMLSGFLTVKCSDDNLIRLGEGLIAAGTAVLLLFGPAGAVVGFILIGLGCAPMCPCLLHSTPLRFGQAHSRSLIGLQVAASTLGNCVLPSLFGLVANHISISLFPGYIILCLGGMFLAHRRLAKLTA